jgi:uncharacterized protein YbjT (DUF2867 family)
MAEASPKGIPRRSFLLRVHAPEHVDPDACDARVSRVKKECVGASIASVRAEIDHPRRGLHRMTSSARVLLTGATGFVGKNLYPALVAHGFDVLCGSRHGDDEAKRDPTKRFCTLDLADAASVAEAMKGVRSAVYLVHSMGDGHAFEAAERANAETFIREAEKAGVSRVVYLGGMRPAGKVSAHLESRLRTGEILRAGRVPTVEIQATMIIGRGSESFLIVRDLAARLPFMLLPAWLKSVSEPVAIDDVVAAIVRALEMPLKESRVLAAPGPERLTGREAILRTARLLGHSPRVINVPFVTPRLSSYWIRLVTRAKPAVASAIVEGLRSDIVAHGPQIWEHMPGYTRTPFDVAVSAALRDEDAHLAPVARLAEHVLTSMVSSPPKVSGKAAGPASGGPQP